MWKTIWHDPCQKWRSTPILNINYMTFSSNACKITQFAWKCCWKWCKPIFHYWWYRNHNFVLHKILWQVKSFHSELIYIFFGFLNYVFVCFPLYARCMKLSALFDDPKMFFGVFGLYFESLYQDFTKSDCLFSWKHWSLKQVCLLLR